jgi:tRNA dimethylallyltransferase
MNKLLIVCGPTATGKTSFALKIAKMFNGEIISADSRQVYKGMDIVTGKDLPPGSQSLSSNIKWKNRFLKYYLIDGVKTWLYDIVNPDEPFNVSFWKECADLVINRILRENKLPVLVGGTGLYLKTISQPLQRISVPPNQSLRISLFGKSRGYLFNYLNKLDPQKAAFMNLSDRNNPRRLIRAIEIVANGIKIGNNIDEEKIGQFDILTVGLTAPPDHLQSLVARRIFERLNRGAETEARDLLSKYKGNLPSMSACGYRAFKTENYLSKWRTLEYQYSRRQITWFKKQPGILWFDITSHDWRVTALAEVDCWYNKKEYAQKD